MYFQVRYNFGKGSFSYDYFEATEDFISAALDKVNENLKKCRQNEYPRGTYKPSKTVYVVQYNKLFNRPVRGGLKLKLGYCYFEMKNKWGERVEFKEWYEIKK